jgi:hypothetical protein
MIRMFALGLLTFLLLTACAGLTPSQPAADSQGPSVVTVFKSPT